MKEIIVFIIVSCIICYKSYAQIEFKAEYFGKSSFARKIGDKSAEKVGDSKGSARVYEVDIKLPFFMKKKGGDKTLIWGVGAGYFYTSLHNENFTDDLVLSEMMNAKFGLFHLRPLNEKWSFLATCGVGVFTSSSHLSKIRARHILGNIDAIFIRHFSNKINFGFGAAVNSTFGYPMIFPALFFSWEHSGRFNYKIAINRGAELLVSYNLNKHLRLSLVGEMNGQLALLKREGEDVMFSHSYYIGGIRTEFRIGNKIIIPLTVGVQGHRLANFNDRTLKAAFNSADEYFFNFAPYLSVGLNIGRTW